MPRPRTPCGRRALLPPERLGPAESRKPRLTLAFDPDPAPIGARVTVSVVLDWPRDRSARGVRWSLRGEEETVAHEEVRRDEGYQTLVHRQTQRHAAVGRLLWGAPGPAGPLDAIGSGVATVLRLRRDPVLPAGRYRWDDEFVLPAHAAPSIGLIGRVGHETVEYRAEAHVDVAAAADVTCTRKLVVVPPSRRLGPVLARAEHRGAMVGCRLAAGRLGAGETLRGVARFHDPSGAPPRFLQVSLRLSWRFHVARIVSHGTRVLARVRLPVARADSAAGQPFEFVLPPDFVDGAAKRFSTRHAVIVEARAASGPLLTATAELPQDGPDRRRRSSSAHEANT